MNNNKTVTFGVIAYNEEKYLSDLLNDLLGQTYDKRLIEVILVDGYSTDETSQVMKEFQENYKNEYKSIKVLFNSKRIQPAGWNVVINNMTCDVLMRIDAHSRLPVDFIEKSIKCITSGEDVCGGPRENIIDEDTPWKFVLLSAEQSMFGSGFASYRKDVVKRKYVKSVFHGAYKKEVINKVGLFNEDLVRTEDNEFHYRIIKAGYRICYDPKIKSYYQTRNSLTKMLKQKFLNGLWIGKTLFICPKCISLFHLVPVSFIIAIVITTVLAICNICWPVKVLWLTYGIANLVMTCGTIISNKRINIYSIVVPLLFLLLHLSYGIGTLFGLIERIIREIVDVIKRVIVSK